MSSQESAVNVFNLTHTSIGQFVFFMKALAENDLWDQVEQHLESQGCTSIIVSAEPIRAVQEMLKKNAFGPEPTHRKRAYHHALFLPSTSSGSRASSRSA
jgi:hypothetical protein